MNEQQRLADWATVHRPDTSAEELARIARAHPEFMSAIAAHPNAPGVTVAAEAPHTHYPVSSSAQFATTTAPAPSQGALNVMGIIALAILVLHAVSDAFLPMLMSRSAYEWGLSGMMISFLFGGVTLAWTIVAGAFALAGTLQKRASRMRWTAIGSLVACGLTLISLIASLFTGLFAPLLY